MRLMVCFVLVSPALAGWHARGPNGRRAHLSSSKAPGLTAEARCDWL